MTISKYDQDFLFEIDRNITWRVKEISALKSSILRSNGIESQVLLRSFVPMIYAHWEGAIRSLSTLYFKHICGQKIQFNKLHRRMYVNYLLPRIDSEKISALSMAQKAELINEILDSVNRRFTKIDTKLISSQSNLNSAVLEKICHICAVDFSFYAAYVGYIDKALVGRRNAIAHGEEVYISPLDMDDLADTTFDLIRNFKNEIENNVILGSYRAAVVSARVPA